MTDCHVTPNLSCSLRFHMTNCPVVSNSSFVDIWNEYSWKGRGGENAYQIAPNLSWSTGSRRGIKYVEMQSTRPAIAIHAFSFIFFFVRKCRTRSDGISLFTFRSVSPIAMEKKRSRKKRLPNEGKLLIISEFQRRSENSQARKKETGWRHFGNVWGLSKTSACVSNHEISGFTRKVSPQTWPTHIIKANSAFCVGARACERGDERKSVTTLRGTFLLFSSFSRKFLRDFFPARKKES